MWPTASGATGGGLAAGAWTTLTDRGAGDAGGSDRVGLAGDGSGRLPLPPDGAGRQGGAQSAHPPPGSGQLARVRPILPGRGCGSGQHPLVSGGARGEGAKPPRLRRPVRALSKACRLGARAGDGAVPWAWVQAGLSRGLRGSPVGRGSPAVVRGDRAGDHDRAGTVLGSPRRPGWELLPPAPVSRRPCRSHGRPSRAAGRRSPGRRPDARYRGPDSAHPRTGQWCGGCPLLLPAEEGRRSPRIRDSPSQPVWG